MNLLAPLLLSCCLALSSISAQTPQFAVVKPNGTTSVYTSWATAYSAAENDDYIYLPGSPIFGTITIAKRLHIFGAGFHSDSSSTTGKTIFTSNIAIVGGTGAGASGGSLEGVIINSTVYMGGVNKIDNYSIKLCTWSNLYFTSTNIDSFPSYLSISDCIFNGTYSQIPNGNAKYSYFTRNLIAGQISNFNLSIFKNNCFLYIANQGCSISESTFDNNIFLSSEPFPSTANCSYNSCYNSFHNNLKIGSSDFFDNSLCPTQAEVDNMSVPNVDSIFISYSGNGSPYGNNYHLKPTCPGVGAGTDGTDLGIYGTNNPTPPGWVPTNPHIFFKQIDSETGLDGKLHIQVGVRANSN